MAAKDQINPGAKRKKSGPSGCGSDSEPDEQNKKTCIRIEPTEGEIAVCSCPKNVMKCIGILPSLPINYYHDSDDSDSSVDEELSYTVLPRVSRPCKEQREA